MKKGKVVLLTLSPKSHRTAEENLGLGYLASILLENNYDVKVIDAWLNEMTIDQVLGEIEKEKDLLLVGISSYMTNTLPTIELINKIKKFNIDIKILCGGFGPTFYPTEYLNFGADIVVRGEGEITLLELTECINGSLSIEEVKGISFKNEVGLVIHNEARTLIENLDKLPFPNRTTIKTIMKKKATVNLLTARGCSGNCEFCSVVSFFSKAKGKIWRSRSITNIVDELDILNKLGVKHIKMVDDSFVDGNRDGNWCAEFKNEIVKRNLKFYIRGSIRADKVTDIILKNLKQAGFYSFSCGIESGSSRALQRMKKKATLSDNEKALKLFKKYDYFVQMGYIMFDKDTTVEELEESYRFLKKYHWTITKGIFSEMFSAEGTQFTNRLKSESSLIESNFIDNNNKYTLNHKDVFLVYNGLKMWQKNHNVIYDMVIDPLSSPKAIDYENLLEFYKIAMKLKKIDLYVFRRILDLINADKGNDILDYVNYEIENKKKLYAEVDKEVGILYIKNNLCYDASENPFF